MARLPRLCPSGIPQHIVQRGNNRQICFASEEDMSAYLSWLNHYTKQFAVQVHAWVLMTNHVHLLVTPTTDTGVSQFMQALGRHYVRYFNHQYRRSGTLWEGRFKSCVVQSEEYLLYCYRYIELNPVRAGMVDRPEEYPWSSYQCNGLGKVSKLCSPHPEYCKLGSTKYEREKAYRRLFDVYVGPNMLKNIRDSVNSGLALGSDRFKAEIEKLHQRRVTVGKSGRPVVDSDESKTLI